MRHPRGSGAAKDAVGWDQSHRLRGVGSFLKRWLHEVASMLNSRNDLNATYYER